MNSMTYHIYFLITSENCLLFIKNNTGNKNRNNENYKIIFYSYIFTSFVLVLN